MSSDTNNNVNQLRLQLSPFMVATEVSPELADIIEIDRTLYTHWAIYVGDGDVVHICGTDNSDLPDTQEAMVKRVSLVDVVGDNFCRINNKEVPAKERFLQAREPELVVRDALEQVGNTVDYNMLTCNGEHYLCQWKYGQGWSDQAAVALTTIQALRREHKNSTSDGHNYMVNSLNEVLNSPGANSSGSPDARSSPSLSRTNSLQLTSSAVQTETTHVI